MEKFTEYEGEKVILFVRKHWASMIKIFALITVLLLMPVILFVVFGLFWSGVVAGSIVNILVVVFSIYYFVMISFAFVELVTYYYDVFIITERTITDITQQGIFGRQVSEVPIARIQDVSAKTKGFLQTIFHFGDVVVETAGEKIQTFVIDSVPYPEKIADRILHLHKESLYQKEESDFYSLDDHQTGQKKESSQVEESPKEPICQPVPEEKKELSKETGEEVNEGQIDKDDLNKGGEVQF